MDHAISIDGSATRATPNERLEALKARYVPTPSNQRQLGDGDMNKIMDLDLYEATKEGDVEKFIDALEEVSESRKRALSLIFNQVTPSGNSLLHVAASSGKEDVMDLILSHFPYLVTRKNSSEDTPLHVAIQNEMLHATAMLIRLGTDSEIIYWTNKDSKSPLYLAAETGCLEILQLLLEASARDEDYAVKIQGRSPVLAALEVGKSDMLEEIIDRLPKLLHVHDEDGGTPLHSAALVGNVGAVQLLLSKCRYLALQTDKNGSYPIHIACKGGNVDTIRELIKIWPDLAEIKNKKDRNILHVAAEGGKIEVVQCILNDCRWPEKLLKSKDVDGNTPLRLALMHNHREVMLSLTRDNRSDMRLLNNQLSALDVIMPSGSSPPTHEVLRGGAIPIVAGPLGSIDQDLQSTRELSSAASQSARIADIKKEIETLLVAATLVASVTFTAGLTLPGGYNGSSDPDPGLATMLHHRIFQVFVIFDALATYGSILSVVILLRAHNSNACAEEYFDIAGPLLFWSVNSMTVAFSAALILSVSKLPWLAILLLCLAINYLLTLLGYLVQSYASSTLIQTLMGILKEMLALMKEVQRSHARDN